MNNEKIEDMKADTTKVLVNNCIEKIKFYIGHKARCTNKNRAIKRHHESMMKNVPIEMEKMLLQ